MRPIHEAWNCTSGKQILVKPHLTIEEINNFLGDLDIYLLDQVLKGNIQKGRLLDIGFGEGRNLIHFFQAGYEVFGIELDKSCLALIQLFAKNLDYPYPDRFRQASATGIPFDSESFDTIVCCRLFHFLSPREKEEAWNEIHRLLVKDGLVYFSCNSVLNFEEKVKTSALGKPTFPDGSTGNFLTDEELTMMIADGRFQQIEPVRHIQYDNQHAETILVLRKK